MLLLTLSMYTKGPVPPSSPPQMYKKQNVQKTKDSKKCVRCSAHACAVMLSIRHFSPRMRGWPKGHVSPATRDRQLQGTQSYLIAAVASLARPLYTAAHVQESFMEARVIVFILNEDWLDSIPCNQEFEALIARKPGFR